MAKESIAGVESYVVMSRADLGIAAPERETPHEMTFVYSIVVKPGKNAEWEATMEKVIEASSKVNPNVFWNTCQGTIAAPDLYMIRVNLDWKDMNALVMPVPARLKVAFGDKKGERIWQDNIDVVESMETNVSRFRLDLSHPPQS